MKKIFYIICTLILSFTFCTAYAAKYKVGTNGSVKTNTGNVIVSPQNINQQNYYNIYNSNSYVSNKTVNSGEQSYAIDIVMDYSGSMSGWIDEAKRTMTYVVSQIPSNVQVGFRVFGQSNGNNKSKSEIAELSKIVKKNGKYVAVTKDKNYLGNTSGYCSATASVTPIMNANSSSLLAGMNSVGIGGSTPLVYGLDRAVNEDFAKFSVNIPKKIVLITDGGENCGGNPCEFAKQLMQKRKDIRIDVVITGRYAGNLTCLSSITGGNTYTINNMSDFAKTLIQSATSKTDINTNTQQYEFYED